ncbi:MAG TPA: GNAT family N-acetyltransferase [Candidatus Didemnitutus sp.]
MEIRALAEADIDAVLQLWLETEGVEVAEGDSPSGIASYLARNPGLSKVAVIERQIVGAVLCGHDGRRGFIYHLTVRESHRGTGVGRQLVKLCLRDLQSCRIERVLALVASDNVPGRAFWIAAGFEEIAGASAFGIDIPWTPRVHQG